MLLVKTHIAPSQIHNLGLFADEFIPAGTEVWRFTPGYDLELTVEEMEKHPQYVFGKYQSQRTCLVLLATKTPPCSLRSVTQLIQSERRRDTPSFVLCEAEV